MKLNKFAYIYIQNQFEIILKNNEKNTWKFPKNLEISWKYHGTLSVQKSGNPEICSPE